MKRTLNRFKEMYQIVEKTAGEKGELRALCDIYRKDLLTFMVDYYNGVTVEQNLFNFSVDMESSTEFFETNKRKNFGWKVFDVGLIDSQLLGPDGCPWAPVTFDSMGDRAALKRTKFLECYKLSKKCEDSNVDIPYLVYHHHISQSSDIDIKATFSGDDVSIAILHRHLKRNILLVETIEDFVHKQDVWKCGTLSDPIYGLIEEFPIPPLKNEIFSQIIAMLEEQFKK